MEFEPIVEFAGMDTFCAGFSCQSVSILNNDHETARGALGNTTTKTGKTFHGVLCFLQRCRPSSFLLENVQGLERNGQVDAVIQDGIPTNGNSCVR